MVLGAVVVVRRLRLPWIEVVDVEIDVVRGVGTEDAIPVDDQRVASSTFPSALRPVLMRSLDARGRAGRDGPRNAGRPSGARAAHRGAARRRWCRASIVSISAWMSSFASSIRDMSPVRSARSSRAPGLASPGCPARRRLGIEVEEGVDVAILAPLVRLDGRHGIRTDRSRRRTRRCSRRRRRCRRTDRHRVVTAQCQHARPDRHHQHEPHGHHQPASGPDPAHVPPPVTSRHLRRRRTRPLRRRAAARRPPPT